MSVSDAVSLAFLAASAKPWCDMSEDVEVRVSRHGATEVWTLDRPAQRNALSKGVVRELGRLARAAAADDSVRAIVLTGAGDKAFCSGADLKERRTMAEADVRDFLALYRTEFRFVDELPKPVIAAINGVAFEAASSSRSAATCA